MLDLTIERGDAVLAASYSPGGDTALVAIHGAAEGTREGLLYEHLHRTLPPHGTGVVTFDRRGEGESTGEVSRGRFGVQADDALAVAATLDVATVGLWGYSQGGWVAPLAATRSEQVAFLALVASTGVSPSEQMAYAAVAQLRRAGFGADVVDYAADLRTRFEEWVRGRRPESDLEADLAAAADEDWFPHLYLPSALLDEKACSRWIEEMDFDPTPIFADVRVPTLAFYGSADSWTPVMPSVDAWREARGDEIEVVIVEGAEHDLTYPDGSLAPEYERVLLAWLAGLET